MNDRFAHLGPFPWNSERIEEAFKSANLTVKEAAEKAGISLSHLRKAKTGAKPITKKAMHYFKNNLNIPGRAWPGGVE